MHGVAISFLPELIAAPLDTSALPTGLHVRLNAVAPSSLALPQAAESLPRVAAAHAARPRRAVPSSARAELAGSELASPHTNAVAAGPQYLRASELDSKPVPLGNVEPVAPASAATTAGRVVARLLINESGTADAVRIESSEPRAVFDDAVVSAFGSARYRPGMKGGRPVKSQLLIEVLFHEPSAAAPGEGQDPKAR